MACKEPPVLLAIQAPPVRLGRQAPKAFREVLARQERLDFKAFRASQAPLELLARKVFRAIPAPLALLAFKACREILVPLALLDQKGLKLEVHLPLIFQFYGEIQLYLEGQLDQPEASALLDQRALRASRVQLAKLVLKVCREILA